MNNKNIAVFAYDFLHKKTQDFLLRLQIEDVNIKVIFAADKVPLNILPSTVRTKLRYSALVHPRQIAESFNIDYRVIAHNSEEIALVSKELSLDIGIISGARVLKRHIIDAFNIGIINFHPAVLPEIRGLDAMLWSVYKDVPLGVTAHLIDEHIDAGRILEKQYIPVFKDDSVFDLSNRLHEMQLDLIKRSIERAVVSDPLDFEAVNLHNPYHSKMDENLEKEALSKLPEYIKRHSARMSYGL